MEDVCLCVWCLRPWALVFERRPRLCAWKLYPHMYRFLCAAAKNPHGSNSKQELCTMLWLFFCYFPSNKAQYTGHSPQLLASAHEVERRWWVCIWVFLYTFFWPRYEETQCLFKIIFSSFWAFYSPKWMVTIFPAFVHISFSRWNSTDILLLTACSRHNQPTSDSRNVKTLNCPLFSRLGENDGE